MLIDLKIKNWKSFRDETEFSLVATDERQLRARVPKIRKSPILRVSPVAALYGGNASGKTNLFSILSFLRGIVLRPPREEQKEIPVDVFALSGEGKKTPTEISLSFLPTDEQIYELHLILSPSAIIEESLSIIKKNKTLPLYSRKNNAVKLQFSSLERNKDAQAYARLVTKNQLFIGIVGSRVPQLKAAYLWFRNQLTLINTRSSFRGFWDMFSTATTDIITLAELLKQLDTGICKLGLEETTPSALPIPVPETELLAQLNNGSSMELNFEGQRYVITRTDDRLIFQKMVSYHRNHNGEEVKFDLFQESEGSLRLLDILPAFIDLERKDSRKIYVIDELDRSWHYMLSRRLLGIYLSHCSEASRSQLLFSTHDLMLMDQNLFRRDEMWITGRNEDGVSTLFSLANCGIRYDKDIRKLYLQGALGGVPQLARFGSLLDTKEN